MIRIICTECKNAYLQNKDNKLICPSCNATFDESCENLLLGMQYYNEANYSECDNCLMKYIVKNGAEPRAVIYKALCDARNFDEDTISLEETYKKILDAFKDLQDEDYPRFIAVANDEAEIIEKALSESHVRLFADADAEIIKKEVTTILNIRNEAKAFREKLAELVVAFNERSTRKISAKFSDCFYVEKEISAEVGNIKFEKICENIASHTVFTGILTNDIKNLEIYYRCIVMFFQKSHDKYEFLLSQAEKFNQLAELLEAGQYTTVKGTNAIADKLKSVSYDFLQESYKEHFDEQIDTQAETVVVIEPELPDESEAEEAIEETEAAEIVEAEEIVTEEATEDIAEDTDAEANEEITEDDVVIEIPVSDSISEENAEENNNEDSTEEAVIEEDTAEAEVDIAKAENEADEAKQECSEADTTETEDTPVKEEVIEQATAKLSFVPETIHLPEDSDEIIVNEDEKEDITEENASEKKPVEDTSIEETVVDVEEIQKYQTINYNEALITDAPVVEELQEEAPRKKKRKKSRLPFVFVAALLIVAAFTCYKYVPGLINEHKYTQALALYEQKKYTEAATAFKELGNYSDSKEKITECQYNNALKLEEEGKFTDAKIAFENLGEYSDASTRAQACAYSEATLALENGKFETASKLFIDLGDYGNSKEMVKECAYKHALSLMEKKKYDSAIEILKGIKKYSDAKEKINEAKYMYVTENFDKENKQTVKYLNELTSAGFRNSAELRVELLGSADVLSENVSAFVNYSSTDLSTSLTQLENTKPIYFHVVVNDTALYGQTLTLKYTTAFGYSQRQKVTLSESKNAAYMSYPSTRHKNYTVTFELLDSTGKKVAEQKISF